MKTNDEILKEVLNEHNFEAIIYTALGRLKKEARTRFVQDLFEQSITKAISLTRAEYEKKINVITDTESLKNALEMQKANDLKKFKEIIIESPAIVLGEKHKTEFTERFGGKLLIDEDRLLQKLEEMGTK